MATPYLEIYFLRVYLKGFEIGFDESYSKIFWPVFWEKYKEAYPELFKIVLKNNLWESVQEAHKGLYQDSLEMAIEPHRTEIIHEFLKKYNMPDDEAVRKIDLYNNGHIDLEDMFETGPVLLK